MDGVVLEDPEGTEVVGRVVGQAEEGIEVCLSHPQ